MQRGTYYSQIVEIWDLNYLGFKVALFRCRWVHEAKGVTNDKYGFTSVDLKHVRYKSEPFVLAKDVRLVFYVIDTTKKKCHMVLIGKRRIIGVTNVIDEEEFNEFDKITHFATAIVLVFRRPRKLRTYALSIMKRSISRKHENGEFEFKCQI